MGITGLLPFLKTIHREVHVSSLRGRKVAVDSYCWLHKGAYSCAMQLVTKTDRLETLSFIKYCMKRVNMLRQNDVTPIMVFDGGYLPTKAKTERDRREKRETYLQKGKALLKEGRKSEANDCFQKSVDVSPEMALALIKECRRIGVECIVAPYEADAQLTYLQKEGIVDVVITEDSDLLVFGCQRVLYKMDDSGHGKLIQLSEVGKANKSLVGFTPDSFRQMCILSGCDYLPSVPGIGLGTALKLMRKHNKDPYRVIKHLCSGSSKVPPGYEEGFKRAEYTFLYQLVFDPRSQKQVRLNELPEQVDPDEFEFAGVECSPRKAIGMARGNINPITSQVMDSYSPSKAPPPKSTSWVASAMGGSSQHYPLAIQSKIQLSSSEGTKKPFRPPKKTAPVEDVSMKDEELQALYSIPESMNAEDTAVSNLETEDCPTHKPSPKRSVMTVSRFFSQQQSCEADSELTPTDSVVLKTCRAVRKLKLSQQQGSELEEEGEYSASHLDRGLGLPSQSGDVQSLAMEEPRGSSPSSLPDPSQGRELVPESLIDSPCTRRESLSLRNPTKKRLRFSMKDKYGYTKTAKRPRFGEGVTPLDELPTDTSPLINLPSTVSVSREGVSTLGVSEAEAQATSSILLSQSEMNAGPDSHSEDQHMQSVAGDEDFLPKLEGVDSQCQSSSGSFPTSQDFITPATFLKRPVYVNSTPSDSELHSNPLDSGRGADTAPADKSDSVPRQSSMLLKKLVSSTSKTKSGNRNGLKVGLSRRKSNLGFKAPRSSESGLKQTSFLKEYTFQKKPRMSL